MRYFHRGWHRIADEFEALLRSGSPVCEHWFFMRDPRVAEIAATVSKMRLEAPKALPTNAADVNELFHAAMLDPARLFDEGLATANQFLDFHLALVLHEAEALGLCAIKPILPDAAGIADRVQALGDAFNRFHAAKADAVAGLVDREERRSPDCSFTITIEAASNIACFRLAGYFERSDVQRLGLERDRVFQQLTSSPNMHLALVDIRRMVSQPIGGFTAFAELLLRHEPRALRLAFLVEESCASRQAQLAAPSRGAQFFLDEADAREWLLGYDKPIVKFPGRNG